MTTYHKLISLEPPGLRARISAIRSDFANNPSMGDIHISLMSIVLSIAGVLAETDPALSHHNQQVASISFNIGKAYGLNDEQLYDLVLAAALHDIGVFSTVPTTEREKLLEYDAEDYQKHAFAGYKLLSLFPRFTNVASLVRDHHVHWKRENTNSSKDVQIGSQIIHMADRIATRIDTTKNILGQTGDITNRIIAQRGKRFNPELVDCFLNIAKKEAFWLDAQKVTLLDHRYTLLQPKNEKISLDELLELSKLFSVLIDFRNRFTATHTAGVATTVAAIASILDMPDDAVQLIRIAGYLHDFGKLIIPNEIIDKPSALDPEEILLMRQHTYYTHRILSAIPALSVISEWAAYHHERMGGGGYPFHLSEKKLSLESRIMAVADVLTAITEDRPYRGGMNKETATRVLRAMADANGLDSDIVELVVAHYDSINEQRRLAQEDALKKYQDFRTP